MLYVRRLFRRCVKCEPPACPDCPENTQCQISVQTCDSCPSSSCQPIQSAVSQSQSSTPSRGAIASGAVGGVVGAGLLAAFVVWFLYYKRKRRDSVYMPSEKERGLTTTYSSGAEDVHENTSRDYYIYNNNNNNSNNNSNSNINNNSLEPSMKLFHDRPNSAPVLGGSPPGMGADLPSKDTKSAIFLDSMGTPENSSDPANTSPQMVQSRYNPGYNQSARALSGRRGSDMTFSSVATSNFTRSSNIIPIAYIPGVSTHTDDGGTRPNSLAPTNYRGSTAIISSATLTAIQARPSLVAINDAENNQNWNLSAPNPQDDIRSIASSEGSFASTAQMGTVELANAQAGQRMTAHSIRIGRNTLRGVPSLIQSQYIEEENPALSPEPSLPNDDNRLSLYAPSGFSVSFPFDSNAPLPALPGDDANLPEAVPRAKQGQTRTLVARSSSPPRQSKTAARESDYVIQDLPSEALFYAANLPEQKSSGDPDSRQSAFPNGDKST